MNEHTQEFTSTWSGRKNPHITYDGSFGCRTFSGRRLLNHISWKGYCPESMRDTMSLCEFTEEIYGDTFILWRVCESCERKE